MVPADSRRIPRAPRYSGYRYAMFRFVYRTITFYGCSFQNILLTKHIQYRGPTTPPMPKQRRFGLFPGRSPLLGESLVYFLFLEVLRCFSSLGLPLYISQRYTFFKCMGCPIRKSSDQRLFAPTRSLSQLITSFIASVSLGIRHTPFLTFFFTGSSLLLNCFSSKMNGSSYFQLYCFLNYC